MYIVLNFKYPIFLADIMEVEFSWKDFRKILKNHMKIPRVWAELFYADRQTDMKKLIIVFPNFAKTPKKLPLTVRQQIKKTDG